MRTKRTNFLTAFHGFGGLELNGTYTHRNGTIVNEKSYMFSLDGLNRAEVLRLIFLSGEESVLEITDDRGWLLFSDGSEQYIGKIVYTDERPDRDHTQLSEHRFFYFSK